jgi:hypothetical protein
VTLREAKLRADGVSDASVTPNIDLTATQRASIAFSEIPIIKNKIGDAIRDHQHSVSPPLSVFPNV